MTKKELIDALMSFDDDDIIVLASDAEGNNFEELHQVEGDFYLYNPKQKDIEEITPITSIDPLDGLSCIVLWP